MRVTAVRRLIQVERHSVEPEAGYAELEPEADDAFLLIPYRRVVDVELGLEPSKALQLLERSILRQDTALELSARPFVVGSADDDGGVVVCPFKGLAFFDVGDAEYFYGREQIVADLVSRLAGGRFVGLVGSSGGGKSSILRAGLVSALAGGVLPGSAGWRPGSPRSSRTASRRPRRRRSPGPGAGAGTG